MKKKFLSLMMAAAVVATTSVSAFADTQKITDPEQEGGQANVTITGDVKDSSGATKPNTLNVTVPTAANFTVDQNKKFVGTKIKVENNGTQNIDVFAYEFVDPTVSSGVIVKKKLDITNLPTNNVALRLEGSDGTAYFASEPGAVKGVYKDEGHLAGGDDANDGVKLANIAKGSSYELRLEGEVGSSAEVSAKPERDNFILKLKIKKAQ